MCGKSANTKTSELNGNKKKLAAYNLPIWLISLIEDNAKRKTTGNRSALVENVLRGKLKLDRET